MNKKQIVILRGLPGCGKSTYIGQNFPAAVVASADHYFMVDGEYRFNPALLGEAHGACVRRVIESAQSGAPLIVVDNTSLSVAEIAPYVAIAQAYGYDAEIITLRCDPVTAANRNIHGVPAEVILKRMVPAMAAGEAGIMPWWKHRVIGPS